METGVLRVTHNGARDDLMDTIVLPGTVTFKMEECKLYFGGVPPGITMITDMISGVARKF